MVRVLVAVFIILVVSLPASAQRYWSRKYVERAVYSHYGAGLMHVMNGDWEAALDEFREAARLRPQSVEIQLALGEALFNTGDVISAERHLERALELDSSASDAHLLLAEAALQRRDFDEADSHLTRRIELSPADLEARLRLGFLREQRQDFRGALEVFNDYPGSLGSEVVHFHRGVIYAHLERNEEALQAFREVLRVNPGNREAAENIAVIAERLGDDTAALGAWDSILQANPSDKGALGAKVRILFNGGRLSEMGSVLADLAATDPGNARLYRELLYRLALERADLSGAARIRYEIAREIGSETEYLQAALIAAQTQSDTALVIESLQGAFRESPRAEIGIILARTCAMEGRETDAIGVLNVIIAKDSGDTEALWLMGLVYERLKEREKALEAMLKLVERDSTHAEALNYVGYTWAERGIFLDRAEEFVKRSLSEEPDNPQYLDSLGWIYYQRGIFGLARTWLEKAYAIFPEEPTIMEHLGEVYVKLGKNDEALAMFQKSLATNEAENPEFLKEKIKSLTREAATDTPIAPVSTIGED